MQVAALSVTDWEDFRSDLSPKFDLSASAALAIATPDTRRFEESVLDAVRARLGIKLAPSGVLTEGFGPPTAPAGSPEGTPPTLPGVTAAGDAIPTGNLEGDSPRLGSDGVPGHQGLGSDAFLQYLAATALFQEVKLLERYVQDAVKKKGYQAYVVRLQVTSQPHSEQYGYDAYANIGFFSDPVAPEVSFTNVQTKASELSAELDRGRTERIKHSEAHRNAWLPMAMLLRESTQELRKSTQSVIRDLQHLLQRGSRNPDEYQNVLSRLWVVRDSIVLAVRFNLLRPEEADKLKSVIQELVVKIDELRKTPVRSELTPIVVPLLVTDQVEGALLAGRYEELRQLNLAISAAYAGIGADASLEKVDQAIQKAAGRAYRSLYTVGRLSDNTLRVRMAARQVPDTGDDSPGYAYQTMARSHNVSLLLLVPRDQGMPGDEWEQDVHIATRYEYRWPDTGEKIAGTTVSRSQRDHDLEGRFESLLDRGGYLVDFEELKEKTNGDDSPPKWRTLISKAQGNRFTEYMRVASGAIEEEEARRLYLDLQVAKLGSNRTSSQ
ncbi:MAG: hypothetical protein AAGA55_05775, partial [Planctomycetota bacterium]